MRLQRLHARCMQRSVQQPKGRGAMVWLRATGVQPTYQYRWPQNTALAPSR